MNDTNESVPHIVSFRDSLLKALDEGRYDDMVLLLANKMRSHQETISPHTRSTLPIDGRKANPIRNTMLTKHEAETFDIREKGWYLVAVKDEAIIGAERFVLRGDEVDYPQQLINYQTALLDYYGEGAQIFAAYHHDSILVDWQFLVNFKPEERRY